MILRPLNGKSDFFYIFLSISLFINFFVCTSLALSLQFSSLKMKCIASLHHTFYPAFIASIFFSIACTVSMVFLAAVIFHSMK